MKISTKLTALDEKDIRYNRVKTLLEQRELATLDDLYSILPKSVMATDLGLNPTRFSNFKSKSPGQFKLDEIILLSELIGIDLFILVDVFRNSIDKLKEKG